MDRAARLGPITPEQIQAVLARFDLGTFIAASPVPMGHGGQNIFVDSTAGNFVLRGNPLFPGQFEKERFFALLLHERSSIPVPWPYQHDPSTEIFGWSYVLMPRLPGINVIDRSVEAALTIEDRRTIIEALADTLAVLHAVTWPYPGQYRVETDAIEPLPVPFAAWVTEQLWAKIRRAEAAGEALSDADGAWVHLLLDEAVPALAEPFAPGFTMHDYWLPNTLFARSPSGWHVCGVFDFAEAYSGDGEADLARPLSVLFRRHEGLAPIFLQRYLALRPPRPGFVQRFAVYLLDELLIGWAHGRKMGYRDRDVSLRELSEPLISAVAGWV